MRSIHPVHLASKIKDYGFAAVLEVTNVSNYDYFAGSRAGDKRFQAEKEKEYIEECIRRYNVSKGKNIENFEVHTGLGILTPKKPRYRIMPLDFAITHIGMNSYVFQQAYEQMLQEAGEISDKQMVQEAKEISGFAEAVRDSGEINEFELMLGSHEETKRVLQMLPNIPENTLPKTRGCLAEQYFNLFMKGHFGEEALIIPSIKYNFLRWEGRQNKYIVDESDLDILIACEKEMFYEKLDDMNNSFCIAEINNR